MTAITRRGAMLTTAAAVVVAGVPTTVAAQAGPDPVITAIDRCVALYSGAYPDFDQFPQEDWFRIEVELEAVRDQHDNLVCDVFRIPAESFDGMLAKARLAYRIELGQATDSQGPIEDMEPPVDGSENNFGALDSRQLVWSLLNDFERLIGGMRP